MENRKLACVVDEQCSNIVSLILASRSVPSTQGLGTCTRPHFMPGSCVNLLVESIHSACITSPCRGAVPLELWTISSVREQSCSVSSSASPPGVDGFMIENAVRSHLHFSPLNACLSSHPLPRELAINTRILPPSLVTNYPKLTETHEFPIGRIQDGHHCVVKVRFCRITAIPLPMPHCRESSESIDDGELMPGNRSVIVSRPTALPHLSLSLIPPSQSSSLQNSVPSSSQCLASPPAKIRVIDNQSSPAGYILFSDSTQSTTQPSQQVGDEFWEAGSLLLNFNDSPEKRGRERHCSEGRFSRIGLPLDSSPVPRKGIRRRNASGLYPCSPTDEESPLSRSAPSKSLLGSFEESALHGRLNPGRHVSGFTLQIAASSSLHCSPHHSLPVQTITFDNGDTPTPYLGICSLMCFGTKGYHIPTSGTLQATLFNPQGTVVKVFVQKYKLDSLPRKAHTFIRQRTVAVREDGTGEGSKWLRYLIHYKMAKDRSGKLYLRGDIRMLFSLNHPNLLLMSPADPVGDSSRIRLVSCTEMPDQHLLS